MSDRESNSLSDTVEFFLIAVFFRGELLYENSRYLPPPYSFYGGGYRIQAFLGPGWGEVLILSEFI